MDSFGVQTVSRSSRGEQNIAHDRIQSYPRQSPDIIDNMTSLLMFINLVRRAEKINNINNKKKEK
jgi:hypothetical protein